MPSMASTYNRGNLATAPSTENHIKCIYKSWAAFCQQRGRKPCSIPVKKEPTTGLCLFVAMHRPQLPPEKNNRPHTLCTQPSNSCNMIQIKLDYDLINAFLSFQAERPEMSAANFKKSATFLKAHVQAEFRVITNKASELRVPNITIESPENKITGPQSVSRYFKLHATVKKRKADQDKKAGVDIQSDKERLISDDERFALIEEAFSPSPGNKLSAITRLCFIAQFNKAFQIVKRGEAIRGHTFGMCYVENYKLGPDGKLKTAFVMSNKGKENSVGRRTCTGYVPHYQPLFDSLGSDGLLFIYRFGGQKAGYNRGEVLPDLRDPQVLLNQHIYPSAQGGGLVEITGPQDQKTWSK
jgi:hypothetical protein